MIENEAEYNFKRVGFELGSYGDQHKGSSFITYHYYITIPQPLYDLYLYIYDLAPFRCWIHPFKSTATTLRILATSQSYTLGVPFHYLPAPPR